MLEIIGKPWWWLLLMLIPVVNLVFSIWAVNLLSKSYGHGVGFTLGLIFLSFIFIPILGLGESKYIGPARSACRSTCSLNAPKSPKGDFLIISILQNPL